jgi:hypothetical protein
VTVLIVFIGLRFLPSSKSTPESFAATEKFNQKNLPDTHTFFSE